MSDAPHEEEPALPFIQHRPVVAPAALWQALDARTEESKLLRQAAQLRLHQRANERKSRQIKRFKNKARWFAKASYAHGFDAGVLATMTSVHQVMERYIELNHLDEMMSLVRYALNETKPERE